MLPKLFFIPAYIGSLKYYAKLLPALRDSFDVRFLIVRGDDYKRKGMIAFCEERELPYVVLDQGLTRSTRRIPLVTPLWKHFSHMRACRKFLRREKPAKIVVMKPIPPHDIILKEANHQGIETILLQWALIFPRELLSDRQQKRSRMHRSYFAAVRFFYRLMESLYGGRGYVAVPAKTGVIDEDAKKLFIERYLLPPSSVHVVGMADYQIVHDIKRRVETDALFRQELHAKYSLDPTLPIVLIIAQAHHLKSGAHTTTEQQLAYYRDMIERIREVFSRQEMHIVFKLHPSDKPHLYEEYKKYGVSVLGDEAFTEELVALAALTVSDPWTSANYMILAAGVPALFTNFRTQRALDSAAQYYRISDIISDKIVFTDKLREFKKGTLPRSYDNSHINIKSVEHIAAFLA